MYVLIFSVITFLSMILHISLTMYVLTRCKTRKKISFAFLALPGFLLLLGFLFEINATCIYTGIFAMRVIHMGLLLTVFSLLGFVTDYCDFKLPKSVFVLGVIVSVTFPVLVWTNEHHMLFYSSINFNAAASVPYVDVQYAVFGVLNILFVVGCLFSTFGVVIYKYVKSGAKERKNLFGFVFVLIGGVAAIALKFFFPSLPLDIFVVIGFIVVLALNIIKNDMFDIADFDMSGVDAFTRRILDGAPIMIDIWDESGNIVWCNKKELETFGLKSAKDYDKSKMWPEFQPCGKRTDEMYKKTMTDVFEDGLLHKSGEWTYIAPDGSELPVQFATYSIEHEEQRFLISFKRDLRLENEARQREKSAYELMDAVINSAPVMISIWDKDFNLVHIGQNSADSFGVTLEDYKTRFFDFVPEFQRDGLPSAERFMHDMKKTFEEGSLTTEIAFKHADGYLIDCEAVGSVVTVNGEKMLIMCATDITEKKAKEENEKILLERIRIIYDAAPIDIQYWDEHNNCIDCNKFTLDFNNCKTKQEYFDTRIKEVFHGTQPDGTPSWSLFTSYLNSVRDGNTGTMQFSARNYKGELLTFEVHGQNVNYDGINAVITYSRDITDIIKAERERRRAEIAEETNRAKSRFLARVSHEIRTPITAILGASQIQLKNPALPLTIYKSAELLSKIINDIVDLSMIESEKLVIHTSKYEVASLINDTVSMCHLLVGDKAIRFIVNADENLPMNFIGDFVRIRQILNNLLANAFKYTKEGEVELSLRAEPQDGYTAFIISIRDTGSGMTAEQVQNIYQDYLRFHETAHHITGSGLGMEIVRNLTRLMDADVKIESEPNKGTTVTVTIPQQPAGDEIMGKKTAEMLRNFELDISAKHFNFEPECMHYGSVLVVDDIAANLYVTKGIIGFYDIAVETASSGIEAVDRIKNGEVYDIIFMDHMMPEMDGVEALEKIRATGYELPIVVLTANAVIGEAEKFIACGFDDYLSKPIQIGQLNNVLTRLIRDKQPPEVLREAELYQKMNTEGRKDINSFRTDSTLIENLKKDFVWERKNAVTEIRAAIEAGDFKKAQLAAHSLKSHAALIFEQDLADSAKAVELLIARGEAPTPEDLSALEANLSRVIAHIKQSVNPDSSPVHLTKALKHLDILKPMLAAHKTSSRNHLNELRNIPEAAILIRQVEKYDFKAAVKSLEILRGLIEEGF